MFKERMEIYRAMKDGEMIGNVYSKDWTMKNILKMSDEEIEQQKETIDKEKADMPDKPDDDGGF
jgi:hypothetical protein